MDIGFTGTQDAVTEAQLASFVYVMKLLRLSAENVQNVAFHHGDCIGADDIAGKVAKKLHYRIILHPPTNKSKRAFGEYDEAKEPREYLQRNKDIVLESEVVLAMPAENKERVRSGTWSTIRFARKQAVPRIIIYPDGTISNEAVGLLRALEIEL